MKTLKTLALLLAGGLAVAIAVPATQYHWDVNAVTLPNDMNPPWTLVNSGGVSAYLAGAAGLIVAYLVSTQAADNVYFEQSGASLQMTNQLTIEAVLRLAGGATTAANRGLAEITFTTTNNIGSSCSSSLVLVLDCGLFRERGDSRNFQTRLKPAPSCHPGVAGASVRGCKSWIEPRSVTSGARAHAFPGDTADQEVCATVVGTCRTLPPRAAGRVFGWCFRRRRVTVPPSNDGSEQCSHERRNRYVLFLQRRVHHHALERGAQGR
jgi:hypothetical protein